MNAEPLLESRFPNTPEGMRDIIDRIEGDPWFAALPAGCQGRLLVTLDELLSNQVKYAGEGVDVRLALGFVHDGADLEIRLEDNGIPFDPRRGDPPPDRSVFSLEELPVGGRGLQVVKEMVAWFDYRRESGTNLVILRLAVV